MAYSTSTAAPVDRIWLIRAINFCLLVAYFEPRMPRDVGSAGVGMVMVGLVGDLEFLLTMMR